ncbi:hypothetical protein ACHAQA_004577 [Verticillium albo-atrum]
MKLYTACLAASAAMVVAVPIELDDKGFTPQLMPRFAEDINAGLESCDESPCTIIAASEDQEFYGDTMPRDVADQFWERCNDAGCNVQDFSVNTRDITGLGFTGASIGVRASGTFAPNHRHALILALTELVGGTQEGYRKTASRPPLAGGGNLGMDAWKAPRDVQIVRFTRADNNEWSIQGSVSMSASMEGDGQTVCEILIGTLSTIAGSINGQVGTVLGQTKPACASL